MGDRSAIEWTDATWNPIRAAEIPNRWMCRKVSPGCDNCYAERLNRRFGGFSYRKPEIATEWMRGQVRLDEKALEEPLHWKRPRKIFVCSMTDLFGEWVPDSYLNRVFEIAEIAKQHQFQVLTKRPKRMAQYCRDWTTNEFAHTADPADRQMPPNIWFGTSVETCDYKWRLNYLREVPAAVRFLSLEPLLGDLGPLNLEGIHWVIAGGESGPQARQLSEWVPSSALDVTSHPDALHAGGGFIPKDRPLEWVRSIRDQCLAAGVPFLFKQWGGPTPKAGGRLLDGRVWDEYPEVPA